MRSRPTAFDLCLGTAIVAVAWAIGWFGATSALFSDLARFGIEYRGEAYLEIVAIAQRQLLFVGAPLGVTLILTLLVWGVERHTDSQQTSDVDRPEDVAGISTRQPIK